MNSAWEYSLRLCGPSDVGALALVGSASFLEAFAGMLPGADILDHCFHQHSAQKYAALLAGPDARACTAEIDGAPVGYALVCAPDLPVPTTPDDLELKRIYVLHRFQKAGMGAALMRWSVETAQSMGKRRLLLGVNDGNNKAIQFYQHHGFEHAGTRKFQVGTTICSDLILAKALGPDARSAF